MRLEKLMLGEVSVEKLPSKGVDGRENLMLGEVDKVAIGAPGGMAKPREDENHGEKTGEDAEEAENGDNGGPEDHGGEIGAGGVKAGDHGGGDVDLAVGEHGEGDGGEGEDEKGEGAAECEVGGVEVGVGENGLEPEEVIQSGDAGSGEEESDEDGGDAFPGDEREKEKDGEHAKRGEIGAERDERLEQARRAMAMLDAMAGEVEDGGEERGNKEEAGGEGHGEVRDGFGGAEESGADGGEESPVEEAVGPGSEKIGGAFAKPAKGSGEASRARNLLKIEGGQPESQV